MIKSIVPPILVSKTNAGELYKSCKGKITDKISAQSDFEQAKAKRNSEIEHHERLHQAFGGSQAGSMVIEKDANGVAFAGHVDIEMPAAVNPENPQETYRMAKVAFQAATAPTDMSTADKNVASKASRIMSQALSSQGNTNQKNVKAPGVGNKLDYSA